MPEFWEFPTVSMGLGPLNAIYQARFNRYLQHRELVDTSGSRVWAFVGDGEMDEPEAQGALTVAGRERLDNLTFVLNCNLQRLDGPVRGNGKVIQEMESLFRGAGWNVVKVVWGRLWDDLLAADESGELVAKLNVDPRRAVPDPGRRERRPTSASSSSTPRGCGGSSTACPTPRWSPWPSTAAATTCARCTPPTGPRSTTRASRRWSWPTTIKGRGLGREFESRNATHQMKKFVRGTLNTFRDRLDIDVPDEALEKGYPPYYRPPEDSDLHKYLLERRRGLGGPVPARVDRSGPLDLPAKELYAQLKKGSGKQEVATTMALVRLIRDLLRNKDVGQRIVPIIPDEARTFGMDSFFPKLKIYSSSGHDSYDAVDRELVLSYKEDIKGQILHEGITEAGAMGSFSAAGSSHATFGEPMIPLYIFYSMFGFQRTGDSMWSAGDQRCRGLPGRGHGRADHPERRGPAAPGRPLGPGGDDQPGVRDLRPELRLRDPGDRRGRAAPHVRPPGRGRLLLPDGLQRGVRCSRPCPTAWTSRPVLQGLYRYQAAEGTTQPPGPDRDRGSAMPMALGAAKLLADDFDVAADVWSAPGWQRLRTDALDCEEWNRLHPTEDRRVPLVTRTFAEVDGPIVAVTDWMKLVPDQISRWVPRPYTILGTDGFGRSDTRPALRRHFKIDAENIAVAVLQELALAGDIDRDRVAEAIKTYDLDPDATTEVP